MSYLICWGGNLLVWLFCFKSDKSLPVGFGDKNCLACEWLCLASAELVRVLGWFSLSLCKIKIFVMTIIIIPRHWVIVDLAWIIIWLSLLSQSPSRWRLMMDLIILVQALKRRPVVSELAFSLIFQGHTVWGGGMLLESSISFSSSKQ